MNPGGTRFVLAPAPPARPLANDEWQMLRALIESTGLPEGVDSTVRSRLLERMEGDGLVRRSAPEVRPGADPFPEAAGEAPAPDHELFDALALALNMLRSRYSSIVGDRLLHARLLEAQRRAAERYPPLLFVELDPKAGLTLSTAARQSLAASYVDPRRLVAALREMVEELHCLVIELVPSFADLSLREVTSPVAQTLEPLGFYETTVFG